MSQDATPAPDRDDLLLFAPVVTAYRGANGWSAEVQRAFVAALARCGTVAAAARSVGRNPRSAYRLRARAGDGSGFARAWDEAQRRGSEEALDAAMAGGTVARRTEVFHRGRHVGWRTAYDNRLGYAALRALDRLAARTGADRPYVTMLLDAATKLPNGRDMCVTSPDASQSVASPPPPPPPASPPPPPLPSPPPAPPPSPAGTRRQRRAAKSKARRASRP